MAARLSTVSLKTPNAAGMARKSSSVGLISVFSSLVMVALQVLIDFRLYIADGAGEICDISNNYPYRIEFFDLF